MKTFLVALSTIAVMLAFLVAVAILRVRSLRVAETAPPTVAMPDRAAVGELLVEDFGSAPAEPPQVDDALAPSMLSEDEAVFEPAPALPPNDRYNTATVTFDFPETSAAPVTPRLGDRYSRTKPIEAPADADYDTRLTFDQTASMSTSFRNADFPRTYISRIDVDVTSPNHWVRLTWAGPDAASQERGPFRSSPGAGLGYNDCDDEAESVRDGSNCTPKGTLAVEGFSDDMATCSECHFVTWFMVARGVAFHYYPDVPTYPASHGCVRLKEMRPAQLIHNNSLIGKTEVKVAGQWTSGR